MKINMRPSNTFASSSSYALEESINRRLDEEEDNGIFVIDKEKNVSSASDQKDHSSILRAKEVIAQARSQRCSNRRSSTFYESCTTTSIRRRRQHKEENEAAMLLLQEILIVKHKILFEMENTKTPNAAR